MNNSSGFDELVAKQSPLPFDPADMASVRLLPAEFSRIVGVSKQTVSRWIRDDKITLGVDGRLNPNIAMRQLIRNGNPGRIRARLVKQAYADMHETLEQAGRSHLLEQQLFDANRQIEHLKRQICRIERAKKIAAEEISYELDNIKRARNLKAQQSKIFAIFGRALSLSEAMDTPEDETPTP